MHMAATYENNGSIKSMQQKHKILYNLQHGEELARLVACKENKHTRSAQTTHQVYFSLSSGWTLGQICYSDCSSLTEQIKTGDFQRIC